ncbi:TetR family transcriptional regulator [Pseudonocardia lacus]|uniref:TetR family transcriptional regulator n=1 Tax=Pseudonocardia lacus TaxID=2835865 RepID=UPI001BDCCC1B|nr:TetR family transcriptional regulator [Pseudonocardia lacus]
MPAADRVAERRALLLDAGLELLGTLGLAGTTVRGVCAAARLNARYFYESFADIDALVVAVFDRVVDELREAGEAAVQAAGTDPVARVRALVGATVEFVDTDRRRARVLYVEGRGNEGLTHRRVESGSLIAGMIAAEAGGEEPGVAHRMVGAFVVGGFSELLVRWLAGEIPVERDQLVHDTAELFLALGRAGARLANP